MRLTIVRLSALAAACLLLSGCKLTLNVRTEVEGSGACRLTVHTTAEGLLTGALGNEEDLERARKEGWSVRRWLEGDKTHLEMSRRFDSAEALTSGWQQLQSEGVASFEKSTRSTAPVVTVNRRSYFFVTLWEYQYRFPPSPSPSSQVCSTCQGSGKEPCEACGGTGKIDCSACSGRGSTTDPTTMTNVPCATCQGTGKVACPTCSGTGTVTCSACSGTGKPGPAQRAGEELGKALVQNMFEGQVEVVFPGDVTESNADNQKGTLASWLLNLNKIEKGGTFTASARQYHWERIGIAGAFLLLLLIRAALRPRSGRRL